MKVIVVLDNDNGMMFNGRRLSKDKKLREDILSLTKNSNLYVNTYTALQFSEESPIKIDDRLLWNAKSGDYCFIEDLPILPFWRRIEEMIIYRWNRDYPSDTKLDFIPEEYGLRLTESVDFVGSSHDKITREVYTR